MTTNKSTFLGNNLLSLFKFIKENQIMNDTNNKIMFSNRNFKELSAVVEQKLTTQQSTIISKSKI